MARKKYKTELQEFEEGINKAEDPYDLRPILANAPIDGDLAERVKYATEVIRPQISNIFRRTITDFVQAGRYLKAAEKLIERNGQNLENEEFARFVDAAGWTENFIRCSVRFLEVVTKLPEAIHLPPGRGLSLMLHWRAEKIEDFLLEEIGEKNFRKLTPQRLLDVYRNKVEKDRQARRETDAREQAQRARRLEEKYSPFVRAFRIVETNVDGLREPVNLLKETLHHLTDADRQSIYEQDLKSALVKRLTDLVEEILDHPGWPPVREIAFEREAIRR